MENYVEQNLSRHNVNNDPSLSLWGARDIVFYGSQKPSGCHCPCCGQLAKAYARKINSAMCKSLINLFNLQKRTRDDFFHISVIGQYPNYADFAKLIYWGLIESKEKDEDQNGKTSGYWKITELGKLFVLKEVTVPEKVYLYDAMVVRFGENQIRITDAIKNKFNYDELMSEGLNS